MADVSDIGIQGVVEVVGWLADKFLRIVTEVGGDSAKVNCYYYSWCREDKYKIIINIIRKIGKWNEDVVEIESELLICVLDIIKFVWMFLYVYYKLADI